MLLPFTPAGPWFGFVRLPAWFFACLAAAVLAYLGLVEAVKPVFYRHLGGRPPRRRRAPGRHSRA